MSLSEMSIGGQKIMNVGVQYQGDIYVDVLKNCLEEVIIDENGDGCFRCSHGSVSVYIKKDEYYG